MDSNSDTTKSKSLKNQTTNTSVSGSRGKNRNQNQKNNRYRNRNRNQNRNKQHARQMVPNTKFTYAKNFTFYPIIDACVNLSSKKFRNLDDMIRNSLSNNVFGFLNVAGSLKASQIAQKQVQKYSSIQHWFTAGVHPHSAKTWNPETFSNLKKIAQDKKCVAIGECGLDYFRNLSTPKAQRDAFEGQLQLASSVGKPIYLHCRGDESFSDFVTLLEKYPTVKGIVHCFTGNKQQLKTILSLGYYIGITGWVCDERRGKDLQSLVLEIPEDRLIIETDSPYLIPKNVPGLKGMNIPPYLQYVLQFIAHLKLEKSTDSTKSLDTVAAELAAQTNQNFSTLFSVDLDIPPPVKVAVPIATKTKNVPSGTPETKSPNSISSLNNGISVSSVTYTIPKS